MRTPFCLPAPQPASRVSQAAAIEYAEGECDLPHGPLYRNASYRLVIKGGAGPKEIGKLVKILELHKELPEDDEGEAA